MQNAYEGHSKENEIAETSTEEDVEYKSKDSERMAAARLRSLLTRKRTRSGSLTVAQPTPLQFTPSKACDVQAVHGGSRRSRVKKTLLLHYKIFAETW